MCDCAEVYIRVFIYVYAGGELGVKKRKDRESMLSRAFIIEELFTFELIEVAILWPRYSQKFW